MELGRAGEILEKRRVVDDVDMNVEYTEATWSTEQSIRDEFQNHLDAQMSANVNKAVDILSEFAGISPELVKSDTSLRFLIYGYFAVRLTDNPVTETELIEEIINVFQKHSDNKAYVENEILANIENLPFDLPLVEYLVADRNTGEKIWIPEKNLDHATDRSSRDGFVQKILGVRMRDTGSGYDSRLKSIFDPSKEANPEQAGRFGEGSKISDGYLCKNGYSINTRSAYSYTDANGSHNIIWQAKPRIENKRLFMKGVKVETELGIESGSLTEIIFPENISNTDRLLWDPRVLGISHEIWWMKEHRGRVHIPSFENNQSLLGVRQRKGDVDFVQGIKVNIANKSSELFFDYLSWDKNFLDSRDRNKYSNLFVQKAEELWIRGFDSGLAKIFIEHLDSMPNFSGREKGIVTRILGEERFKYDLDINQVADWRKTFFEAFKAYHQIKADSRYVLIDREHSLSTADKSLLDQLRKQGYTPIELNGIKISSSVCSIYLGENVKNLSEVSKMITSRELVYSEEQKKMVETLKKELEISTQEITDLVKNLNFYRLDSDYESVVPRLVFGEDYKKEVFGRIYNPAIGKHELVINVSGYFALKDELIRKRLLQVHIIANGYDTDNPYMQAQFEVQWLLDEAVRQRLDPSLLDFDYRSRFDRNSFIESMNAITERQITIECDFYTILSSENPSIGDLEKIAEYLNKQPSSKFLEIIHENIFRSVNKLSRFYLDKNNRWRLESRDVNNLPIIGESRGRKVRRFGDFTLADIPPYKSVSFGKTVVFTHEGKVFRSNEFNPLESELLNNVSMKFTDKFAVVRADSKLSDSEALQHFQYSFNTINLILDTRRRQQKTELENGTIKTSLSSEYGKDNWDNPVRFFEDIAQNHFDAGHTLVYYLIRDSLGVEKWVEAEEVLQDHTILGIKFEDDGPGYAPENLRDMGAGEYKSPLQAGKYREGLKMIFAAAARNQVIVQTRSVIERDGKIVSWTARSGQTPERIPKQGEIKEVLLSSFDLDIGHETQDIGSSTEIMFSDLDSAFYQKCIAVIDPRIGGRHKGLARYVKKMRKSMDDSIRVGPVTILLDEEEKGNVYENGLFVMKLPESRSFLGGFDLPSVTSTRERNEIDPWKMGHYIRYFLYNLDDETVAQRLIELIDEAGNYDLVDGEVDKYFDLRYAFQTQVYKFMPSAKIFKKAAKSLPAGAFISPNSAHNLHNILDKNSLVRADNRTGLWSFLEHFLPTELDIIQSLRAERITIDSKTRKKVYNMIKFITEVLTQGERDGKLITRKGRSEVLNRYHNPASRENLTKFTRISQTHYGSAWRAKQEIELNESALENPETTPGTVVHELTHLWNEESDNSPEFIADLLSNAFYLSSLDALAGT